MIFSGTLSKDLKPNSQGFVRSGFCGCLTTVAKSIPSGYKALRLRVKTDGRTYRLNVHPNSWNPNDMYTGFISAPEDVWATVEIPLEYFLETSEGKIKPIRVKPLKSEAIEKIGITLADDVPGPFELLVSRIYATSDVASKHLELQEKMTEVKTEAKVEGVPRKDDSFAF